MSIANLARPEIASLAAYSLKTSESSAIRLNANEAFCSPWADNDVALLNRYPELRPGSLRHLLAALYEVPDGNVLATRGSSEAIDLIIRSFCRAYRDEVLITPPTFGMYKVYADIQGAAINSVPLRSSNGFELDVQLILSACRENTKIIFLSSPNNPTGSTIGRQAVLDICAAREGLSLVVVDEAYVEFGDAPSLVTDATNIENLVVVRTLSKAYALAGARCGAVVGTQSLIGILGRVLTPYSFATPVVQRVSRALGSGQMENARRLIEEIVMQRELMLCELRSLRVTAEVWPSQANFVLVRFHNLAKVQRQLAKDDILIRDFPAIPTLENCARITVGSPDENAELVKALTSVGSADD